MNMLKDAKAVTYARVSTGRQSSEGHSLDVQRETLHAYAVAQGMQVVEHVADEGVSAGNLDRPGVRRVLALAEAGQVDAVLVTKCDRISRSLSGYVRLCEALESKGVQLVTTDEAMDVSTPAGKAMSQLRSVFAELEHGMACVRNREAQAAARARGVRFGPPPCGWTITRGRWEPSDRYPVVVRAHELRADGMTYDAIAAQLQAEGIPTGSGRGNWSKGQVCRLLRSPLTPPAAPVAT